MRFNRYSDAQHPLIYGAVRAGVYAHERWRNNLQVIGHENVPKRGGAVFGGNHRHGRDPVVVGASIKRALYFMAKKELWTPQYEVHLPLIGDTSAGKIAGVFNAFPVDRKEPERETLEYIDSLVKDGKAVYIFPEGSRYEDEDAQEKILRGPELGPLHNSAGWLAVRNDVEIVPVGIKIVEAPLDSGELSISSMAVVIKEGIRRQKGLKQKPAINALMSEFRERAQEAFDEATNLAEAA